MANTNELLETLIESIWKSDKLVSCPSAPVEVPGLDANIYASGDCFGTLVVLPVPKSGIIYSATFLDLDDEGTQVDLEVFKQSIAQVANNAAYAPTDAESLNFVTELSFVSFDDHGVFQTSDLTNIGKAYTAPEGKLWIQAVTRSTPTIAAGASPKFQLQIISKDPIWER